MNTEQLIEMIIEEMKPNINYLLPEDILIKITRPDWGIYQKTHNWKNYVPQCFRDNWSKLSKQTKIVIWFLCKEQADNEEWD